MSKSELKYGTSEAVAFVKLFYRDRDVHLIAIKEGIATQARTFGIDEDELMEAWIEGLQGMMGIYFQVNKSAPGLRDKKVKKTDIVEVLWLHVDVDDLDALERLRAFMPEPTVIVFTGGGYQAFWCLERPLTDIELAERYNKTIAARLGGDNCHNADRVMRVPGTVNVPNKKKRAAGRVPVVAFVVSAEWSHVYPLDAFPLDYPPPVPSRDIVSTVDPAAVVPVGLDALPGIISARVKRVIELGDDPDRPRGSPDPRYPTRSEAVFFVACALARDGCADEVIAGILINAEFGISASVLERRFGAVKYALKQAASARVVVSDRWPDAFPSGAPKPVMRSAVVALLRLGISFGHDIFRHRRMMSGASIEGFNGEISDDSCMRLRTLILSEFGFDPKTEHVRDAVDALCLDHEFHPICDMLGAVRWDGVQRIGTWLTTYMGADDNAYVRAVGRLMLIAAVRRVRQPGVKFDQIVVLEGEVQGKGKSTALQILAGPGNHADLPILTQSTKEQMELMDGIWIYELGEIEGIGRAEVNAVKAFASRTEDRARMAYGRFTASRLRQTIFVGTTNDDKYLRDETGNRRFWPVKTGEIDLEGLRRDRDQLWAEAATREADGESLVMPQELWAAAAVEQAARREEDPWTETLENVRGKAVGDIVQVATYFLLSKVGVDLGQQSQWHTKRIAAVMKRLGWTQTKWRDKHATVRGYQRPKPPDHRDDVEF